MSDSVEDKALEEYLRRKSALSMGYRRIYVEAPPVELDRAITARARRALRWLVPGVISAVIAISLIVGLNSGIGKLMTAIVSAERNIKQIDQERKEQAERERLKQPVSVVIDAKNIAQESAREDAAKAETLARQEWREKIEKLKAAGKQTEAGAELQRFQAAYPDSTK